MHGAAGVVSAALDFLKRDLSAKISGREGDRSSASLAERDRHVSGSDFYNSYE